MGSAVCPRHQTCIGYRNCQRLGLRLPWKQVITTNPILLNLEEYPVGKTSHSRTATAPVDDREIAMDVPQLHQP